MKSKLLFSIFVYFFILVFIGLGSWQLVRLNWKLDLISKIEQSLKKDPININQVDRKNFVRIIASGKIDYDKQIYLYNLNDEGKPGFEVINPIIVENENYLINRGWIPFKMKDNDELYSFEQSNFVGTLRLQPRANIFKPENDINNNYWFTLNREDIFKYTGKEFSKYLIYLGGNYEVPKPKKITANISNNHKKYALTWFSLAISIFLIYLYFRKKNY
ncbi:SURF1 family protein [Candidatus Pelagibacter sp.]|uniref:SURF1 family protein n=1 Tax=Candidatus Pelagibacter sp. TaxID=2024849 RepID=UPI003F86D38C